jgi:hypothetical protein
MHERDFCTLEEFLERKNWSEFSPHSHPEEIASTDRSLITRVKEFEDQAKGNQHNDPVENGGIQNFYVPLSPGGNRSFSPSKFSGSKDSKGHPRLEKKEENSKGLQRETRGAKGTSGLDAARPKKSSKCI